MATESFYISVDLSEKEKLLIQSMTIFKRDKLCKENLIYKNCVYIDNISNSEDHIWHLNATYINIFDSCEKLYELCTVINKIKAGFEITVLNQNKVIFEELSFFCFIQYIYEKIEPFKKNFNSRFGELNILPGRDFYKFRRKNKKFFKKD